MEQKPLCRPSTIVVVFLIISFISQTKNWSQFQHSHWLSIFFSLHFEFYWRIFNRRVLKPIYWPTYPKNTLNVWLSKFFAINYLVNSSKSRKWGWKGFSNMWNVKSIRKKSHASFDFDSLEHKSLTA